MPSTCAARLLSIKRTPVISMASSGKMSVSVSTSRRDRPTSRAPDHPARALPRIMRWRAVREKRIGNESVQLKETQSAVISEKRWKNAFISCAPSDRASASASEPTAIGTNAAMASASAPLGSSLRRTRPSDERRDLMRMRSFFPGSTSEVTA